ncbi:MAG: TrkA family potassium uptake protein [Lachnospiraceae bacterium]|nr:TrkA family potassium uptake protein [Lachnospiraceae bacterium]
MKSILLIGLGRFGREIAITLNDLKHEVMGVDKVEERVESVLPYVTSTQIGDSTNEEFLRSLGVDNFDVCIVTIGNDFQASLETTSLLKELGANLVVARAATDVHEKFLLRNGADEVVYPVKQFAKWTAFRYSSEHIFDFFALDKDFSIFEIEVPEDWIGKNIGEINIRKKYNINILAVKRDTKMDLAITPETSFSGGELLLVLGNNKDVQKYFHI